MEEDVAKAMVVDDSGTVRTMAKGLLSGLGFAIAGEAASGEDALLLYDEVLPHFVLLDIHMPGIDGIDTLAQLMQKDPDLNVVMLTSASNLHIMDDALYNGAKGFIQKDQNIEAIEAQLQAVIHKIYYA